MRQKIRKYLIWNMICYFGLLAICVIIKPHFWFSRDEGGISNFGLYRSTVIFYGWAFVLSAVFISQAAALIPKKSMGLKILRASIYTLAILIILALLDTYFYKQNLLFKNIHIFNGIVLALFEMAFSVWLTFGLSSKDKAIKWFFAGHLLGFVLSVLTYFGTLHVLFTAQMITTFMFELVLIYGVNNAVAKS